MQLTHLLIADVVWIAMVLVVAESALEAPALQLNESRQSVVAQA
jgi:hypothetical protein